MLLEPLGSFDLPVVPHEEEIEYLYRLPTMVPEGEKLVGMYRGYELSFCCLYRPFDCFYLIRDAGDLLRESIFECWQRASVRGPRFRGWHNLEIFALP